MTLGGWLGHCSLPHTVPSILLARVLLPWA